MNELNSAQVLYTIIAAMLTVITAAIWIIYARTTVVHIETKLNKNKTILTICLPGIADLGLNLYLLPSL